MRHAAWCLGVGWLMLAGCSEERAVPAGAEPEAAVVVWAGDPGVGLAAVLDTFSAESGIPVELRGGATPPGRADLLVTADLGRLSRLAAEGALRPTYSDVLEANSPRSVRDPESAWFGLAWEPLVIVYDRRAADAAGLQDYAALAASDLRGRLCLGSSALGGNRLLLAALIAQQGERATERMVRGWIDNLAEPPLPSEPDLLTAIEEARCAVGIAGVASLLRRRAERPESPLAARVPAAGPEGTIALLTAAGVTRHATNPTGAAALLEWLTSEAAQERLVSAVKTLPVNPRAGAAAAPGGIAAPGRIFDVAQAAKRLEAAVMLAERARYR